MHLHILPFFLSLSVSAYAACYNPTPFFPVPSWLHSSLAPALSTLSHDLTSLFDHNAYNTSSYSITLTSSTQTLWSTFHTARVQNVTRPGTTKVGKDSIFRIASNTKPFTVLAILQQVRAGTLRLDDPVSDYIPAFTAPGSKYLIHWHDITLRSLASYISGIPNNLAQEDLLDDVVEPADFGLPVLSQAALSALPSCALHAEAGLLCTTFELLAGLAHEPPIFAPNAQATYSNLAFELLGLVVANVTNMTYESYIQTAIFDPLGMTSSSFLPPDNDTHSVLPLGQLFFDIPLGVQNPTGGIFSTASDMAKYTQYVLANYNTLAKGVNWFLPTSPAGSGGSFYGMPWEIFRTEAILGSGRTTTFVTKDGGSPMYYSRVVFMPEYGLAATILVGGELELLEDLNEVVTVAIVKAAEKSVQAGVKSTYAGHYTDARTNTSVYLSMPAGEGLVITALKVRGVDVLATPLPLYAGAVSLPSRAQLVPTGLFRDEAKQNGEIWRFVFVPERTSGGKKGVWDDFCSTDEDQERYGGKPINEVVFLHGKNKMVLELSAWRVNVTRS